MEPDACWYFCGSTENEIVEIDGQRSTIDLLVMMMDTQRPNGLREQT